MSMLSFLTGSVSSKASSAENVQCGTRSGQPARRSFRRPFKILDRNHRTQPRSEADPLSTTKAVPAETPSQAVFAWVHEQKQLSRQGRSGSKGSSDSGYLEWLSPLGDSAISASRSLPKLVRDLRKLRLSNDNENPTVVRRPELRVRPELAQVANAGIDLTSAELSPVTDPSSYQCGRSVSTGDVSTAKTSLESQWVGRRNSARDKLDPAVTPAATVIERPEPEWPALDDFSQSLKTIVPSIKTVETTTNAKIFFETHFNTLLSPEPSPRSLRKQDLESKLLHSRNTDHLVGEARRKWQSQETEYLRQCRVLKSRSNGTKSNNGVSLADYEVVQVLGKGSFGVVRLVREKSTSGGASATSRHSSTQLRSSPTDSRVATLNIRSSLGIRRGSSSAPRVYAMKVIRKSEMLRSGQEGHLRAERDFLIAAEKSRWVVPLIASFQDQTNLYLVMDFMIGGDFLSLLIKRDRLDERRTQFYIAEMVLCLEEAHRLRWIHRDVKPDNFLISASGHLKISDFGLAFDGDWMHDQAYFNSQRYSLLEKLGIKLMGDMIDRAEDLKLEATRKVAAFVHPNRDRRGRQRHERPSDEAKTNDDLLQWRNRHGRRALARSIVGTSQYMAPEIIAGKEYDGRCDWWSLGVILFECLYGVTPFLGRDRQSTKANILRHRDLLVFPENHRQEWRFRVSKHARDLIVRLLQEKEARLSSHSYVMNDLGKLNRSGKQQGASDDSDCRDARGSFVFPNDAADIKSHAFFEGIDWKRLHLMRPPEVPKVRDDLDARYFEEEGPISDVDDADTVASDGDSLTEEQLAVQEAFEQEVVRAYEAELARIEDASQLNRFDALDRTVAVESERVRNAVAQLPKNGADAATPAVTPSITCDAGGDAAARDRTLLGSPLEAGRKRKEKKRPRDRILRDASVAKQAMEIRKRGAFMGYTYLRPRSVLRQIDNAGMRRGSSSINPLLS